jgi:hypothetical protein
MPRKRKQFSGMTSFAAAQIPLVTGQTTLCDVPEIQADYKALHSLSLHSFTTFSLASICPLPYFSQGLVIPAFSLYNYLNEKVH